MRKKLLTNVIALAISFSTLLGVAGCGGGSNKGGKEPGAPLTVEELGEGFNANYLPDASAIKQRTGRIDVCLDFEGTQEGWKALEKEYERLHGGGVDVRIDTTYSGSQYSETLNYELKNKDTQWDIVEGNLGYNSTKIYCIDMRNAINSYNPYCGKDVLWSETLLPAAYKTKEADTSGESYILNTEVMQTCWFINDVAFQAAVEEGYLNAEGRAKYPVTWDDLMLLCEKMEDAGYSNPLGITLCDASIESLQFTWLLRVYGDYYYRQFYKYIMAGDAYDPEAGVWDKYDPMEPVVETSLGYTPMHAKTLYIMFGEELANEKPLAGECGYVGMGSEVYRDFVTQLAKMKGHLMRNVEATEFNMLRDQFETQSDGKSSPQIMLDYQGFGINYEKATTDKFDVGYFDYPQMLSGKYEKGDKAGEDIVDPTTITRDIGGNGGFLSVINHIGDSAQNELNKDFVKFVMSPYGQTIYYKGLAAAGRVPKGLSSVKNELVVIPEEWKTFFEESGETITFSGDVDANPFLNWGVRYGNGYTNTQEVICEYWRNLLMTGLSSSQSLTVSAFAAKWGEAVEKDMELICADNKWPKDFWKDPNYNM